MHKGALGTLIVVFIASLSLGGFVHAIVPHEHEEGSPWEAVHATLYTQLVALSAAGIPLALAHALAKARPHRNNGSRYSHDHLREALRRGRIAPLFYG